MKDETYNYLIGNLNRMYVTNSLQELESMKEWAIKRVNEIYLQNEERLNV